MRSGQQRRVNSAQFTKLKWDCVWQWRARQGRKDISNFIVIIKFYVHLSFQGTNTSFYPHITFLRWVRCYSSLCFPEDDEQWRSIFLTVLKIGSRKKQKAGDNGGCSSSYYFFVARKQISCQSPGGNALGKNPIQDWKKFRT